MRSKRLVVILIAVAFTLTVIFSCVGLFSVKKVHVDFTVSSDANVEGIQKKLDRYIGANLLFFNTKAVKKLLEDEYYMEVLSVDKQYPNVLKVSVKERIEVYYIENHGKYYLMTADGFVLDERVENPVDRKKIQIICDGVSVQAINLGDTIKTSNDELMSIVFLMAKSVNLTDCIKTISIFKRGSEPSDVTFSTYSGVDIVVEKVEDGGVEKVVAAFEAYDNATDDYVKTFSKIRVYKDKITQQIEVDWSEN